MSQLQTDLNLENKSYACIVWSGCYCVSARIEPNAVYVRFMTLEHLNTLSSPHVPYDHCLVTTLSPDNNQQFNKYTKEKENKDDELSKQSQSPSRESQVHRAALIFVSKAISQVCNTLDMGLVHHAVYLFDFYHCYSFCHCPLAE